MLSQYCNSCNKLNIDQKITPATSIYKLTATSIYKLTTKYGIVHLSAYEIILLFFKEVSAAQIQKFLMVLIHLHDVIKISLLMISLLVRLVIR